jgi:hypothetical protein
MARVKLAPKLPDGPANGLNGSHEQLCADGAAPIVAIVVLDTKSTQHDLDTDEVVPTARIRRIEAVSDPADLGKVLQLLMRGHAQRTGRTEVPIELSDDVRGILGDVEFDPATGEIL